MEDSLPWQVAAGCLQEHGMATGAGASYPPGDGDGNMRSH